MGRGGVRLGTGPALIAADQIVMAQWRGIGREQQRLLLLLVRCFWRHWVDDRPLLAILFDHLTLVALGFFIHLSQLCLFFGFFCLSLTCEKMVGKGGGGPNGSGTCVPFILVVPFWICCMNSAFDWIVPFAGTGGGEQ